MVMDWLGRCRAEMESSAHTLMVTLTYGNDDRYGSSEDNLDAKKLNYHHVKRYLMMLRKWTARDALGRPFKPGVKTRLRYFAVGEYGSVKGRAHWHILIFCEGRLPPNVQISPAGGKKYRYMHYHQKGGLLWPYGWSQWGLCTVGGARYVINYITKDDITTGEEKRMGMSIQPPLGEDYFAHRAFEVVQAGLSPQDCFYSFPDVVYLKGRLKGQPRQFFLGGSAIYNFLNHYAIAWKAKHGDENWPASELMDKFCEERYRRSQYGRWDWRDEPDWLELKRAERQGRWLKAIRADRAVVDLEAHRVRPFPPLSAYERRSSGE